MSSVSDAWIWEIMLCDTQLEGLVGTAVRRGLLILGEVAQSCPTLCDPVDCSLPGFSVHGILQARILEWVAISFSRGSSRPGMEPRDSRDSPGDPPDPGMKPRSPALRADALTSEPPGFK